jgi:predicted HicB family RNase H-like nuclease
MSEILEYKTYYATVQFNAEDKVFHGKIIGINDLISFEGESVPELINAFHEAVDDYLVSCKELGKEPEKTYKGSFNVRIPAEMHKEAARYATAKNMSLNDFVRYAIATMLKKPPDRSITNMLLFCITSLGPVLLAGFVF